MDWTDLRLKVPTAHREQAVAIASLLAGGGLYIEDYSDLEEEAPRIAHVDLIDEALLAMDRNHVVIHLYFEADHAPSEMALLLEERMAAAGIPYTLSTAHIAEEDWATAWKAHYKPVELSDRLLICPSWLECTPKPGQQVVRLDPGMAFGTGTHETTQLCLSLLEGVLRPGHHVLDVGCGSGILSIAAAKLGAERVCGVDIDPVAVRVAGQNAADNGLDLEFKVGDLSSGVTGRYHVVLANIVADIILRLLPDLKRVMLPGGAFVASGIIDTREDELTAAVAATGYRINRRLSQNGWVALLIGEAD